jgi:hypothetical protein
LPLTGSPNVYELGGALLGTGWVGTTGIRFELGPWDLRVRANRLQHGL